MKHTANARRLIFEDDYLSKDPDEKRSPDLSAHHIDHHQRVFSCWRYSDVLFFGVEASGHQGANASAQARLSAAPAGVPGKSSSAAPTTIRYSQSASAGNMVLPAILLGLPTIVIVALIIRSMRGD